MALRQASRLLLVILTAWTLCGVAAMLDTGPADPTELLVTQAYAGDPDEFSDGTESAQQDESRDNEDEGLIPAILDWIEDVVRGLF